MLAKRLNQFQFTAFLMANPLGKEEEL